MSTVGMSVPASTRMQSSAVSGVINFITRTDYERVCAEMKRRESREGVALLALKLITPKDLFQALKDQGKTTRYIRFPREPHGFREPRHQRTRDVEEIRWIQKHLRGLEWTPWERPAEEKKDGAKTVS